MVRWLTALGSCALLFGFAGVDPVQSQANEIALEQVIPGETRSDRNWHAFWRNHLGDWRGRWTRYTPSGEVKETFASSRLFTANEARTEIVQTNRYRYADGSSIRKQWNYNIEEHSQADGFAHPASKSMRGFAFEDGSAAWLIPSLEANQYAPFELYFKRGEIRHSVGVLYGKNGELIRTASIREKRGIQQGKSWSDTVIQVEPWNPVGRWQGKQRQIYPDLSQVLQQRTDWQWKEKNQSGHYLPDGIILRCPERIIPGQSFAIRVIWQVDEHELQVMTANYDSKIQLIAVTHQSLSPES